MVTTVAVPAPLMYGTLLTVKGPGCRLSLLTRALLMNRSTVLGTAASPLKRGSG